ncbi:hypothetical protein OAS86_01330 [Gammaproteobacteria bacterium]|nr:hypothetical protein [Gammaproteobacteria bacterium]
MTQSTAFLVLNASIVWLVLGYVLMILLRSKVLLACLLVLPILALPNLAPNDASIWLPWYGQSLIYGVVGLLVGVFMAQAQQTKKMLVNITRGNVLVGIVARLIITLSGIYLLMYLAQRVASEIPMLDLVIGFVFPGRTLESLLGGVSWSGVLLAVACIAASMCALAGAKFIPAFRSKNLPRIEK